MSPFVAQTVLPAALWLTPLSRGTCAPFSIFTFSFCIYFCNPFQGKFCPQHEATRRLAILVCWWSHLFGYLNSLAHLSENWPLGTFMEKKINQLRTNGFVYIFVPKPPAFITAASQRVLKLGGEPYTSLSPSSLFLSLFSSFLLRALLYIFQSVSSSSLQFSFLALHGLLS